MTHITTHQLVQVARGSLAIEPINPDARARCFFASLLGLLSEAEARRVAQAMEFDWIFRSNTPATSTQRTAA